MRWLAGSHFAFVLASTMVVSAPAEAQNVNWSGFYVGANAGHGWADLAGTDGFLQTDGTVFGITPGAVQQYPAEDSTSSFGGWLGGVQAGYQLQWGQWVAGLEADFQWTDIGEKGQSLGSDQGPTYNTSAKIDTFGTVRLRGGWAMGNVLFYATGGLAYGQGKGAVSVKPGAPTMPVPGGPYAGSDIQVTVGWTVGGGVEFALTEAISLKVEYLHVDLGDATYRFDLAGSGGSFIEQKQALDMDLVRVGLNVRF